MLTKEINLNKKFILVLILLNIVIIGLYYSYALFQVNVIKDNVIVMHTGTINLLVNATGDGVNNNSFTLAGGESKELMVNLSTTDSFAIGYKLYYTMDGESSIQISSSDAFVNNVLEGAFVTAKSFSLLFKNTGNNTVTITLGGIGNVLGSKFYLEDNQNEIRLVMGVNNLMRHVGTGGLISINENGNLATNGEIAREYRYSGGEVNNYIKFNYENWRIIGIFKGETLDGNDKWNIKIIRDEALTDNIDYEEYTGWKNSKLENYLNGENDVNSWYYNSFKKSSGVEFEKYIATTNYSLKTVESDVTLNASYNEERKTDTSNVWQGKVGLIYASDYGYAGESNIWNNNSITMNNYGSIENIKTRNWFYKTNDNSKSYLLMTPSTNSANVMILNASGSIASSSISNDLSIRPVLYLKFDTLFTMDGLGTYDNPYVIL